MSNQSNRRNTAAMKLAVKHYGQQLLRAWPKALPALLLPGVGSILITYIPPLIVARILSLYGQRSQLDPMQLLPYILLLGAVWLIGEVIWRIAIYLLNRVDAEGMNNLYVDAMDYLFRRDQAFFQDHFAGSLTKKVIGYARNYEVIVDTLTFSVLTSVLPLFFVMFVLWQFSPWLVLVLLTFLVVAFAVILPLVRRRQALVGVREEASNVLAGHVADVIGNMDTVRAFARERSEARTHGHYVNDFLTKSLRTWDYQNSRIDVVTSPLYVLVNLIGLVVALFVNHHGGISLTAVFVTFSYYASVTRVVWDFNHIYRAIESSMADAAQFTELLLESPRLTDQANPRPFSITAGAIEFRNVKFGFHDAGGAHMLQDFNLQIAPGERVALVGRSGSGKTTITRLLLRFMDVTDGEILIDGQNIARVKQAELRSAIGYVPQEPALFHRTLADNIRYGRLSATTTEVKVAAHNAHAAEFIETTPNGYETLVGERGVKLSGGQRQRVAIARAMLKNAPILVLDEATSALDSESESLIQDALWKLMEGRTALVIAHRLSTIHRMDRIVVLEQGEVVEQGTHQELLGAGGIYAKLWQHQSGGFLED